MTSDMTKAGFRDSIWSYMETNDIARFPRPVFNRIPNFKGAEQACCKVKELMEFQTSYAIKIGPDKPLEHIRYLTLEANKSLYVPTPRLRHGLLNKITPPPSATKRDLHICATSEGVRRHSVRIGLNSKIKIGLVIVGSVAVSMAGYRIGKGEGFSDMEYAMLASLGSVDTDTTVITVVHECQVFESIPEELFKEHDVPADIIVTPSRIIRCEPQLKKPNNIIWSLLTEEKMNSIPILRTLKAIEDKQNERIK